MRRKTGTLIDSEIALLVAAITLRLRGIDRFFGYLIATEIQKETGAQGLLSHGSLYKTLARLEDLGMLESEWEAPELSDRQSRPRRRLYTVTAAGEAALASALAAERPAPANLNAQAVTL